MSRHRHKTTSLFEYSFERPENALNTKKKKLFEEKTYKFSKKIESVFKGLKN